MKSVIIISTADLYWGNSAAVARMNNYAKSLALANVDVYMLSTKALGSQFQWMEVEPHIFTLPRDKVENRKGYNLIYLSSNIRKIKQLVKSIKGEIVFLNYPGTNSLLQDIMLLVTLRKFPIYCEVNEVRKYVSGSNNNAFRSIIYNILLETTYKWYDGIVFISRHIRDFYSAKARRSIIVPILSDSSRAFSLSKGINTLNFVFVGTVSFPKENLEELFEGFCLFAKEYPEARLIMYGVLSQSDQKRLEDFIEKRGMKDRLLYLGMLQHIEVERVLSTAGALILPRSNNRQNYYGFSTKLSEYAVSGAPIIMTNTGVVADYFKDGINCLMCEGYDRISFNVKFKEFAQLSIEDRKRLSENAYQLAKSQFDFRLYTDLLNKFLSYEHK